MIIKVVKKYNNQEFNFSNLSNTTYDHEKFFQDHTFLTL